MDLLVLLVAVGLALVAALRFRRSGRPMVRSFGLAIDRRTPLHLTVGIAASFSAVTLVFLVEQALGVIDVRAVEPSLPELGLWTAVIGAMALVEELMFRVLLLTGVVEVVRSLPAGRWIGVAATSVVFGLLHLGNPDATAVGAVGTALGGALWSIAFVVTRSLWLPLALHASWNLALAVWGLPISGITVVPGRFSTRPTDDGILSGGSYGPEAGLFGMLALLLVAAAVLAYARRIWPSGRLRTLTFAPEPDAVR
ncbi:CPBP family intramembrane glutamic endopeptidase [Rathayibacter sp. VKM Ac-2630]|uniref:CPBP family intramembrane glutamic endopeptidase n=1 Tax=Rathayibacter sp. VKM Ac-2630 TaxID=1938617 RepID=UPI000981D016|nr:CPBP family intramembrane glutamic endopeptidase [Rathayibacter sp. VKM Ac-2630]OOB91037.1 hypothetical protein B0T42_08195 [Rathayibacter sp. VKM Ac-2630]